MDKEVTWDGVGSSSQREVVAVSPPGMGSEESRFWSQGHTNQHESLPCLQVP